MGFVYGEPVRDFVTVTIEDQCCVGEEIGDYFGREPTTVGVLEEEGKIPP